jgi:hypothetical protein
MEKINRVACDAMEAFWAVVVIAYPEATTGDFLMNDPEDQAREWIAHWVANNVPESTGLDKLNLRYASCWELQNTGGNCMVVYTIPTSCNGAMYTVGVTSECICIYTNLHQVDQVSVFDWQFGDNPTVLMIAFEDYFKGIYDLGQLFNDCVIIAHSTLV